MAGRMKQDYLPAQAIDLMQLTKRLDNLTLAPFPHGRFVLMIFQGPFQPITWFHKICNLFSGAWFYAVVSERNFYRSWGPLDVRAPGNQQLGEAGSLTGDEIE